jgi:hypothetical protein
MTIRIAARTLSLTVLLTAGALAMDHVAAESRTTTSGAAEVKQKQTATATHVVRDHRGQSSNATRPVNDPGWGNDSGATVRDHRKQPCPPSLPGTANTILDLGRGCR